MAHLQDRKSQARKIEDARDLQAQLYREIGISAVAAALRFTSPHEAASVATSERSLPGVLRESNLAA